MKLIWILGLIALPISILAQDNRYVIYDNFRFGFIDSNGEVSIEPRFRNAGLFSEGLAPAREDAYWGFIDTLGGWSIEPKYDYAGPFQNGLAEVGQGELRFWIDKTGQGWSSNKLSRQKLNQYNLLQHKEAGGTTLYFDGQTLQLPSGYKAEWKQGRYIGILRTPKKAKGQIEMLYGIIDTSGQVAVPFGHFDKIGPFFHGEALASTYDTLAKRTDYYFINQTGEIIRTINGHSRKGLSISWSPDGRIFSVFYENEKGNFCRNLMDRQGRFLLKADTNNTIYNLGYGLAAIHQRRAGEWLVANEEGLCCTEEPLRELKLHRRLWNDGFLYGQKASSQWVRFDTNGIKTPAPGLAVLDTIEGARLYYFYCGNLATFGVERKGKPVQRGLLHVEKGLLLPPEYQNIIPLCFDQENSHPTAPVVIAVKKDGKVGYLREGRSLLWQAKVLPKKALLPYDVDQAVPMTYKVRHTYKMPWWLRLFVRKAKLSRPQYMKRSFLKKYRGHPLFLMNDSKDTLIFDARIMGQLSIHLEARDKNGKWQRIDRCVGCDVYAANAIRKLPPGHYWPFRVPKMEGAVKAKLRYVATYWLPEEVIPSKVEKLPGGRKAIYPIKLTGGRKLYSRTFRGGVNPAQFQRWSYRQGEAPFIQTWMMGR